MIEKSKKRKINPMLLNVLLISVLVHVGALFILGGYTVYKYVVPDDAEFEEPPTIEEVEPPKEVKVEIKQQPKAQNQPLNNLKLRQVGNIAIANVDVDLPSMEESFTVSGGLGGSGGSSLLGGTSGSLGLGMSDVSVFGLKTRAERILFVVDANRQMVTDAKGGLNSYRIIKNEITDMVGNLSAGTLFNVMLQDRSKTMLFKPQLSPAGQEVHQQLVKWISGINSNANQIGLEGNRAANKPKLKTFSDDPDNVVYAALQRGWRGNETGFITQYALEQNVDAIFFITGYHKGFETIRRNLTEREEKEWQRNIARPAYIKQMAKHQAEVPQMKQRISATLAKINEDRAKKGMPPRILAQRNGVYSNANELNLKWKTGHPGWRPNPEINDREVNKYFRELVDVLYEDHNKKAPSINVILFLAGDENFSDKDDDQLKDYVREFSGKHRVIRGLDQISSASSAKDTKN